MLFVSKCSQETDPGTETVAVVVAETEWGSFDLIFLAEFVVVLGIELLAG